MNIRQAKEEIKNTVLAYLDKDTGGCYTIPQIRQRPVLLMGPPGIGKTQIMEQIASELQIGLVSYTITHHTRQSAVGLPMICKEQFDGKTCEVTRYTMSEIIAGVYERIRDFGQPEGILFLDEINCASETLTPAMLQFLQCKSFGNQKLPEGWILVAAGNPPEYNRSVHEFDVVTLDRVRYLDIEADLSVWKQYAADAHVHGAILSYLELRPDHFYRIETTVDGLSFVTARGWEDLSTLMKTYEKLKLPVTKEVVREFIREVDTAEDFYAYLELYRKYQDDYRIDAILQGSVPSEIYARLMQADFDERLSVTNLLLDGLMNGFVRFYREKQFTDQWYQFLKDYKVKLDDTDPAGLSTEAEVIYEALVSDVENDYRNRTRSGYLSKEESAVSMRLLNSLRAYAPVQKNVEAERACADTAENRMQQVDALTYFEAARGGFSMQAAALKQEKEQIRKQLEAAFDFMENAFSEGQEMLVFVTGLAMHKESAVFLAANPCARYAAYNEKLLAGTRRGELLKKLDATV